MIFILLMLKLKNIIIIHSFADSIGGITGNPDTLSAVKIDVLFTSVPVSFWVV